MGLPGTNRLFPTHGPIAILVELSGSQNKTKQKDLNVNVENTLGCVWQEKEGDGSR